MSEVEIKQERGWKRYPAYKDSGVEWLGEIPEGWKMIRLKYAAPVSSVKLTQKPDHLPYLGLEHIESKTGRLLLDTPVENVESTVSCFEKGDVLFGKLRPYLAKVFLTEFQGVSTTELLALKTSQEVNGKFLFYQLIAEGFINQVNSFTYGTKMPRVSPEQITSLFITLPPLTEQQAIARFLDRETVKIDTLIAKKERLIELLKEKRTALISHAVTKGLNPDAPMKDSGIEWLGKIPEGWDILALKRIGSFHGGTGFPESEQGLKDEELPFYKVSDTNLPDNIVFMRSCTNSISRITSRKLGARIFPKGAIIFAKVGAALLLNKRRILSCDSCIDNNMMAFLIYTCDVIWAYYWMSSLDLGNLANPGAVPSINESQISSIYAPVPPSLNNKRSPNS